MNTPARPTDAVTRELWKGAVSRRAETTEVVTNALIECKPSTLDQTSILFLLSTLENLGEAMEIQGSTQGFVFYEPTKIEALSEKIADIKTRLELTINEVRETFLELLETCEYSGENISRITGLLPEYEESARLCGYATQMVDAL